MQKHTTPGIRWSSPTQLLIWRSPAYLRGSRRDAEFSSGYGRMCCEQCLKKLIYRYCKKLEAFAGPLDEIPEGTRDES